MPPGHTQDFHWYKAAKSPHNQYPWKGCRKMNNLGLQSRETGSSAYLSLYDITIPSNLCFLKVSLQLFEVFSASSYQWLHHVFSLSANRLLCSLPHRSYQVEIPSHLYHTLPVSTLLLPHQDQWVAFLSNLDQCLILVPLTSFLHKLSFS